MNKPIPWLVSVGAVLVVTVFVTISLITKKQDVVVPIVKTQPATLVDKPTSSGSSLPLTLSSTTGDGAIKNANSSSNPASSLEPIVIDAWLTPVQFLDLAISNKIDDWKTSIINNFSIKYPPQYKLERVSGTTSIIPAIDIPVEPGSHYPLTILVQQFDKTNYAPQHPITSYADGTKISPKVVTISCGGKSYQEEQFEDGGPEMEIRHLRRFVFSGNKDVQELTFSYSNCGYCSNATDGKLEQDKFAQNNEKLKCEILSTFLPQ